MPSLISFPSKTCFQDHSRISRRFPTYQIRCYSIFPQYLCQLHLRSPVKSYSKPIANIFRYVLLNSGTSSNGLVFYHLANSKSRAVSLISSLIFVWPQIIAAFSMIAYSHIKAYLNLKKIPAELLERLNIVPQKMLLYPFCDFILFILPLVILTINSKAQNAYLFITYSLGFLYSIIYLINTVWVQKAKVEEEQAQAQEAQQDESNFDLSKSTYSYLGESMFMSTQPTNVPRSLTSSRMFDSYMKKED